MNETLHLHNASQPPRVEAKTQFFRIKYRVISQRMQIGRLLRKQC